MYSRKFAIVTGASRGLGLGCAQTLLEKGYDVLLTGRDTSQLAGKITLPGGGVQAHYADLDVSSEASLKNFERFVHEKYPRVDVLVNNAGILLDDRSGNAVLGATGEQVLKTFVTNTLGAYRMCQIVIPLMKQSGYGRIVNVSSGMGQLSDMGPGYESYRISKTALNAVTAVLAQEVRDCNILVNSVCPGWVKTDMGGAGATRELKEGVASILWAAFLPEDGPSGGYFRDGQPLSW